MMILDKNVTYLAIILFFLGRAKRVTQNVCFIGRFFVFGSALGDDGVDAPSTERASSPEFSTGKLPTSPSRVAIRHRLRGDFGPKNLANVDGDKTGVSEWHHSTYTAALRRNAFDDQ